MPSSSAVAACVSFLEVEDVPFTPFSIEVELDEFVVLVAVEDSVVSAMVRFSGSLKETLRRGAHGTEPMTSSVSLVNARDAELTHRIRRRNRSDP